MKKAQIEYQNNIIVSIILIIVLQQKEDSVLFKVNWVGGVKKN